MKKLFSRLAMVAVGAVFLVMLAGCGGTKGPNDAGAGLSARDAFELPTALPALQTDVPGLLTDDNRPTPSSVATPVREYCVAPEDWTPVPGGMVSYPTPLPGEDGTLFGYLISFSVEALVLELDPAEWWSEADAEKLAEIGTALGPNGYFVFNPYVEAWGIRLAPEVEVRLLSPKNVLSGDATPEALQERFDALDYYMSVRVTIEENQVVLIEEVYRP